MFLLKKLIEMFFLQKLIDWYLSSSFNGYPRKTKIIATIASTIEEIMLVKIIQAGVDFVRINLSHLNGALEIIQLVNKIRMAAYKANRKIEILADLSGPKIRTGVFPDGHIMLEIDQKVIVSCSENITSENEQIIFCDYPNLVNDIKIGDPILLDDGKLELRVQEVKRNEKSIVCKVIRGGELKNKKGINLPNTTLSLGAFTPKDKKDMNLCLHLGIHYYAASFVQNKDDMIKFREFAEKFGRKVHLTAKIETKQALCNLKSIAKSSDALMVARGDLGAEIDLSKIYVIQKLIMEIAKYYKIPFIIATQMLESMCNNIRPLRAEITDISVAVINGAFAVMLSGETASGNYPVEAVKEMSKIICATECRGKL